MKHKDAIFIKSGGIFVAKVYGHDTQPVEANARLIAAAPELLGALKVLVDHAQETYPHCESPFESPRGQADIAAALAAIAKATQA